MTHSNRRYKVLVADSEKNTREAMTEIFTEAGYRVSSSGSGSETIERLTRDTFDLILCDIDMPRTSGQDIVRMARALNRKAMIVVLSSSAGSSKRIRLKREGAFELLDKPLRKATLLSVAKAALKPPRARRAQEVS